MIIAHMRRTPIRPMQMVRRTRRNEYAVQEGGAVRYKGTSWGTATRLFTRLAKEKPDVGVLLTTNGNVSRRYIPRKEGI